MAAKSLFTKSHNVKKCFILLFFFLDLHVVISHNQEESTIFSSCKNTKCYMLNQTDKGKPRKPPESTSTNGAIFCFSGLNQQIVYVWSNPTLRIKRQNVNSSTSFLAYFGDDPDDVEKRSQQPGYTILQRSLSSMRSLQHSEDLSLSPFTLSCYKIETNTEYNATLNIRSIDVWYLAYLGLGILIFFSAKTWSHNTSLHYGSGVSIGVLASVLILFYVLSRMLPSRLKTIAYILCLFGTSATMFMFSSIQKMLSDNVADMFLDYWQYLIAYIIVTGLLSFAVVYRYGPIEDRRTLSLIQWFLQAAGLVLVYNSSQIREVSIALVILLLTIYNFPKVAIKNQRFKNMWYKLFPPKIRLLSEDEYIRQGDTETRRELEKLREFCRSPECKTWKVISKLKDPHRFAEFIEGDSWHVTNAELLDYDSDPDPVPPHLLDEDNEEEEMDFQLGSP